MDDSLRIEIAPNLELRLRDAADAPEFFRVTDRNRAYLREWLPWVDANTTVQHTENFIRECAERFKKGIGADFGIMYEGKWVGSCGLREIDRKKKCGEIGYWLDADFQGKGIVTRCAQVLLEYAVATLRLHRIIIRAAVGNTKSRAVADRLGFSFEGIAREEEFLYDHYVDIAYYSMLAHEVQMRD